MKNISNAQLIDETTAGLNYLSKQLEIKKYKGGIIGPAASALFLTILLTHADYKKSPTKSNVLNDFYKFSTKTDLNDFELIGCMRHALAHNDFYFEFDFLVFKGERYGTLKIPYKSVGDLTNKLLIVFNRLNAKL